MNSLKLFILAVVLCLSSIARAQLPVPPLTGHVIDKIAMLSKNEQADLEKTLQAFEEKKGSQMVVLIVSTSKPETIEQYALRISEQWKLGRKKIDDGVLMVIAKDDRAIRIEVGYGLEAVLNDATSKRIIAEIMTPYFKRDDFVTGINAGVTHIIRVVEGEPLP